jgi:[acyl-carrier-protein] S-malonyltransferase
MPGFALLFPGQGSQYVGMGQDLYASSPAARAVFDEADLAWQGRLRRVIFEGPAEELTDTVNAQPALYVTSMACWAALREALGDASSIRPEFVAGHSLGEYTALAVSGAYSFETGQRLVTERGRAMKAAGEAQPGAMAAILGLSAKDVAEACRQAEAQTHETVVIANDNAPGQIVVSGTTAAVSAAAEFARTLGARRAIPLAVSIASHSPLMRGAVERFGPVLRQAEMGAPVLPVLANRSARSLATADEVVAELEGQLTSPVRWTETIEYMVEHGIEIFVEVGPKDVLTGLLKRIAPTATGIACGDLAGVARAAEVLGPLGA